MTVVWVPPPNVALPLGRPMTWAAPSRVVIRGCRDNRRPVRGRCSGVVAGYRGRVCVVSLGHRGHVCVASKVAPLSVSWVKRVLWSRSGHHQPLVVAPKRVVSRRCLLLLLALAPVCVALPVRSLVILTKE